MIASQDAADACVGKVTVDLEFTAGAAGAVPAALTRSTGIVSVVKSGNNYVVTFDQSYLGLDNVYGYVQQAVIAAGGAREMKATAQTVASAAPTVTLSFYDVAGTALSLLVNDIVRCSFVLLTKPQPNAP